MICCVVMNDGGGDGGGSIRDLSCFQCCSLRSAITRYYYVCKATNSKPFCNSYYIHIAIFTLTCVQPPLLENK